MICLQNPALKYQRDRNYGLLGGWITQCLHVVNGRWCLRWSFWHAAPPRA
jgi:hypothetical protein